MKKYLFPLLVLFANCGIANAQQKAPVAKLSPLTQLYLQKTGNNPPQIIEGYVYKKDAGGHVYISTLIKIRQGFNEETLRDKGIIIGTKAGEVWTLQVPLTEVVSLTQIPGIAYVQLDEPVFPLMDSVRVVTRVDSVHRGINLPAGFTGKNVVMGIVDVGFDYTHPLFFDTTGAKFRVKKVWEQKTTTGTPPAGFIYGREITDSNAMWTAGTDINTQTHGTHVAGIAAGSGVGSNASNTRFRGVAFGTDVVLVGITPTPGQWQNTGMSDIIDGMNYIYSYATSVGKPAVVNLSWGCSVGPHDGMSLFSTAVDNLTGAGKLFACSAGNTGSDNIHLGKSFTTTDTIVSTFVTFDSYLAEKKTWIDIWGDSTKSFCANVTLYDSTSAISSTGFICLDNILHNKYIIASTGDTCYVDFTTSTAEFNGKPRIFLNIYNKSANSVVLTVKSTNANVHIWEGFVQNSSGYYGALTNGNMPWATAGNTISTISDWSATKSAIPVGAFASRNVFTNINGFAVSYTSYVGRGRLVPFSSRGPSADGRIKPFITAPGFLVGSGASSYDLSYQSAGSNYGTVMNMYTKNGRNYPYAMLSGTSMSSPVVSGILALMLEANSTLTPQQAQDILAVTAIQDANTGVIPAAGLNTWGHGKVNAYAAIKKVLQQVSVGNVIGKNMSWSVFPNPSQGLFNIECTANKATVGTLEVTDVNGRVILSQPWKLSIGNNHTNIDIRGYATGIYLTNLITEQGRSTIKMLVE